MRGGPKRVFKEITPEDGLTLNQSAERLHDMVVSRCRGNGPPSSGIVLRTLFFVDCRSTSSFLLVWPVPRVFFVIPRAVSLRVSISQCTGILGIPLPALLSNIAITNIARSILQ